jgi:hypothetical protein
MKRLFPVLAVLALACPRPQPPGVPTHGIVQCGTEAIQKCAPGALPAVNECLSGQGDVTDCLLGLIMPAGCVTYEVVACLVRHEGAAADHAAQANPADALDVRRARRAREFLAKTGAQFE